jgi:hypothetical protein
MKRRVSPILSLAEPLNVKNRPQDEFIPLGTAPLNQFHVLFLAKEPLSEGACIAHEHPITQGPFCTQYIVQNVGGSFIGHLFVVQYKHLVVTPFRMHVGDLNGKTDYASVPANNSDSSVLLYQEADGGLLAIPGQIKSRHVVADG